MDGNRRFQFGLKWAFAVTSAACALSAIAALWPRLALAIFPLLVGWVVAMAGLVALDKWVLKRDAKLSPAWGSWGVIAVSVCTVVIIAICRDLPGGSGPVQYTVGSDLAKGIFDLRAMTLLVFVTSPAVFGVVGAARLSSGIKHRLGWSFAALATYVAAWSYFCENSWFFPTV